MEEIWKDAIDYPGYQVSNLGRVRDDNGIRHQWPHKGYWVCKIFVNGVRTRVYVHRLIATAFVEGKKDGLEVNHKNAIKSDNSIDNLEWVTRSENVKHAYSKNLLSSRGTSNGNSMFSKEEIIAMRSIDYSKITQRRVAKIFGISFQYLNKIVLRKVWTHI